MAECLRGMAVELVVEINLFRRIPPWYQDDQHASWFAEQGVRPTHWWENMSRWRLEVVRNLNYQAASGE